MNDPALTPSRSRRNQGFALITVMLLVAVLAVMVTAYFMLTQVEMTTAASSQNSTSGFYAAEAGLNIRGQELRKTFVEFDQPKGKAPRDEGEYRACQPYKDKSGARDKNQGEGDFQCQENKAIAASRRVITYVTEPLPPGASADQSQVPQTRDLQIGPFAGLSAQEFIYDVNSESFRDGEDLPEARLQTTFRSQLIPLFQFAAFYEQDLEIAPGQAMTLEGRVHSNNDLYLMNSTLDIKGKVTSAGGLYGGRKLNPGSCSDFKIGGNKGAGCSAGLNDGTSSAGYTDEEIAKYGTPDEVQQGVNKVQVPEPKFLDPDPDNEKREDYWEKADLRVVLVASVRGGGKNQRISWSPEVQDANGKYMRDATKALRDNDKCRNYSANGPVSTSDTFHNNREGEDIRMLEVDMEALLECIDDNDRAFGIEDGLRNRSEGGLVFHFSIDDSDLDKKKNKTGEKSKMNGVNNYGVRVKNGAELDSKIKGLTVATNQAMYVQGDYNSDKKKPASFLADSLNILSNDWHDLKTADGTPCQVRSSACTDAEAKNRSMSGTRKAANTTVNAAFLAGVDQSRQNDGYNGGLENYPRLHEEWGKDRTLKIRGSFVSLGEPQHVDGRWGDSSYSAPKRDWNFDKDFLEAGKLPPLTPRFVNLVQQLFTRSFDRNDWNETDPHLLHNTIPGTP